MRSIGTPCVAIIPAPLRAADIGDLAAQLVDQAPLFPALNRLVIGFVLAVGCAPGVELARNATRYDFSAVPMAMAASIASGTPRGVTLMIVKDRQVVFEHAVGNLDLARALPIASASKMPTTTVIMSLVAQGLIGLDDRIADHLSFWPQSAADPRSRITVRQCLSNTSGLPTDDTWINDRTITLCLLYTSDAADE